MFRSSQPAAKIRRTDCMLVYAGRIKFNADILNLKRSKKYIICNEGRWYLRISYRIWGFRENCIGESISATSTRLEGAAAAYHVVISSHYKDARANTYLVWPATHTHTHTHTHTSNLLGEILRSDRINRARLYAYSTTIVDLNQSIDHLSTYM